MARLILRLCALGFVYLQLCDSLIDFYLKNSKELIPAQSLTEFKQCEKVVNFLKNVLTQNKVFRDETVNIAVADYSTQLDTSCMMGKLQQQDDRIVFDRFTRIKYRYWTLEPDYLILIEDYTDNVSIRNREVQIYLKVLSLG